MKCLKYLCFSVMILLSDIGLAVSATGNKPDVTSTEIKSIKIETLSDKDISLSVAYRYDGKHGKNVYLSAVPLFTGNKSHGGVTEDEVPIREGAGVARIVVHRYTETPDKYVTELLQLSIFVPLQQPGVPMPGIIPDYNVYQKTVPLAILWPTMGTGVAKVFLKNGVIAKKHVNIPLPKIQIKNIKLVDSFAERLVYEIQYEYDGKSGDDLTMTATAYSDELSRVNAEGAYSRPVKLYKGKNTATINVMRIPGKNAKLVTDKLTIKVDGPRSYVDNNVRKTTLGTYLQKTFLTKVAWTDVVQVAHQAASSTPSYDERFNQVVSLIDEGIDHHSRDGLQQAKKLLDQLLIENPKYVPAYIQLARYQETVERNQKGLKAAEQTLNTALNLDKKNAEVYIVLGDNLYWQNRLDEAEKALKSASDLGTSNLWLYVNYARVFIKKGQNDKAIEYLEKLTNRKSYELSNTRPLKFGYGVYIYLLTSMEDFARLEKVFERRQRTFEYNGCYLAEYSAFELFKRGDYEKSIRLGEKALKLNCSNDGYVSRRLSYAYLVKWATKYQSATKVDAEDNLYLKAKILNADMSEILYNLSNSQKTESSIGIILRTGVKIDAQNQDSITATGLAVQYGSLTALKKLINSGANINTRQGSAEWSLLMIAAYNGNEEVVKYLLDKGADVDVKSKDGYTARKVAEARGFNRIAKLLGPKYRT